MFCGPEIAVEGPENTLLSRGYKISKQLLNRVRVRFRVRVRIRVKLWNFTVDARMHVVCTHSIVRPVNNCQFIFDRLPNITLCGPARDTVLSNQQTGKLNFDTNYTTIKFMLVKSLFQ